jgi:hypothetical protein
MNEVSDPSMAKPFPLNAKSGLFILFFDDFMAIK